MTETSDDIPIESFERLGLTTYETRVFVALQRLSTGTVADIASVADVPRSRVYDTAATLTDRGLIEQQQSDPLRYRAVDPSTARNWFRERYEAAEQEVTEYLQSVRHNQATDAGSAADVWMVRGRDSVEFRIRSLVDQAAESVWYGVSNADLLTEQTGAELSAAANRNVDVVGLSSARPVLDRFDSLSSIDVRSVPPAAVKSRLLIVDDEAVLLSTVGPDSEAAIWSRSSTFATVLIDLVRRLLADSSP